MGDTQHRIRRGQFTVIDLTLGQRPTHDQHEDQRQDQRPTRQPAELTSIACHHMFRAQEHNHKQEQNHDGPGIDGNLDNRQERGIQHDEQERHTGKVHDQEQGAVNRVLTQQHADGRRHRDHADYSKQNNFYRHVYVLFGRVVDKCAV